MVYAKVFIMVYANRDYPKNLTICKRLKNKLGKLLAQFFPLNKVRVLGLKLCGFDIGEQVYIGQELIVASVLSDKSCHLIIGDRVAVGPRVTILLSSDANWSKLMEKIKPIRSTVVLEDDCWIGAGAIIMPNISVGQSAIIGSGAVVVKNVEPLTVVAGNPAKVIRRMQ